MPEFDAHASPTSWIVGQGLKLLEPAERQSIVEGWRAHRRGCWPSLVVDGGCDVRIGAGVVTDRVRTHLLEWLPLAPGDLAVYEGGLFRRSPADALTLLVRPPAIWSIDEAVVAGRLTPRGHRFVPEAFEAVEHHALRRLRDEQLTRLRAAVSRIEAQLPLDVFPVASAIVAAGCAVIAADDESCAAIAARQLARYAASALVARVVAIEGDRLGGRRSGRRSGCYCGRQLERVRSARVRLPYAFVICGGRCISYGRRNR